MITSATGGMERSNRSIYMTKEQWESVVLEMPEHAYVDPVMYAKCAKKLGMNYNTFWKWYQVWWGTGKDCSKLPFIKTEAEIREMENDKRRNRKAVERVSDLPKIQWRK